MAKRYERVYGGKYDANLTATQIAAKIKNFVKTEFPGFKFSVRSYDGRARKISVEMTDHPANVVIYQAGASRRDMKPSPYFKEMSEKINAFANQYNYDGSDVQSDYADFGFYFNFDVSASIFKSAQENLYGANKSEMKKDVEDEQLFPKWFKF